MADKDLKNQLPQLEDPKTLEHYQDYFRLIQTNNLFRDAKDLADVILALFGQNPDFSEKNPEMFQRYQNILIRCRWIALSLLKDSEVPEMFENYFLEGLAMMPDINLWEELKAKLIGVLVFEERDKLKKEVRKALERNNQLITEIPLETETEKRDPTVGNWILDFTANLGDNMFDRVKESQYFINGRNTKQLSNKEKDTLRILLDIYRRCGLSSLEIVGVEEGIPVDEEDRKGIIREGQFEEIKPSEYEKILNEIQKLMQQNLGIPPAAMTQKEVDVQRQKLIQEFLGPEQERELLHKEESNLEKAAASDLAPLKGIFLAALNQKDKYKAIAVLRILAQKGKLLEELKQDEKINGLFKNFLKEQYQTEILADFQRQGFIAPYFSLFLQRVLKNQLGMSDSDSARIGIQLENILIEKGITQAQGMVYGDLVTGQYVWQEVKDEGVRLSLPKEAK
ncbi:MAG: hypothetical protein COT24_03640 [Candidatus Kerfeldbacteria bacterium CG08_land_8_20_14_0_20_40_16]|uniref:Uncharacterized protein n=1 Tax=Candidatus Kerfeldbacteria bacterium CG08_land_8_20_14_0_20_40_16 TaxID=2014244 RepID=A0A2H0YVB4_9BACT|nr:MAG: hypothetical protein COT24_03640 [Candidatus Kerfeldbacteria bacterium CG08_land_8_20_14_0_20_40_16]